MKYRGGRDRRVSSVMYVEGSTAEGVCFLHEIQRGRYLEVRLSFIKYRVRASRKCEKERGGL